MIDVGLTGGIGSGKSTVAGMLEARGALVIDADALAREALAPGTAATAEVLAEFGDDLLLPDGTLDRATLAGRVFGDEGALARLESIVHPVVARLTAERRAAAPRGSVVVHDVPLLVEKGLVGRYDLVVVVEAPQELRLQRLLDRGLRRTDALARMAAQASDEQRRAVADAVLVNDGSVAHLEAQVAALWAGLTGRARPDDAVGGAP